MRFVALILILTIYFTAGKTNALAQETYAGLKGGFNLSKLNGDGNSNIKMEDRKAYSISVVYSYIPQNNALLGFTTELGYNLKGTRFKVDTFDYKFHYLSMPVLLDFYPTRKLKISAGPELSYLFEANTKRDTTRVSILSTYNKRWELSGTIGVSYSVAFYLDLGLRYNTALTRIAEFDAVLNRRRLFNQYLQAYLMFKVAN